MRDITYILWGMFKYLAVTILFVAWLLVVDHWMVELGISISTRSSTATLGCFTFLIVLGWWIVRDIKKTIGD